MALRDPFVMVAIGHSLFRIEDRLALVALLRDVGTGRGQPSGVKARWPGRM